MLSKKELKSLTALHTRKFRQKEQQFLVEGLRNCEELIKSDFEIAKVVYCQDLLTGSRAQEVLANCQRFGITVEAANRRSMNILSNTVHPQGIIAVAKRKQTDTEMLRTIESGVVVALDRVSDPGNAGTIIRTASWFGAAAVILAEESVEYTNPKVVRASMGAIFHLPVIDDVILSDELGRLSEYGFGIYLADSNGGSLFSECDYGARSVLVVGNETAGIAADLRNLAEAHVYIPRRGTAESLNVSVATAIILNEMTRQL